MSVKLLGALKESISAAIYGIGNDLDSFNIAFGLASFLIFVVGAGFQIALIPVYFETRKVEGLLASRKLLGSVFTLSMIFLLVSIGILVFILPYLLPLIMAGSTNEKVLTTYTITITFLPLILLGGLSLMIAGILNAEEAFKATSLAPGLTSLSVILTLFLLGKNIGIFALVIGVVTGSLAEFIFLLITLKRKKIKLNFSWNWRSERLTQVVKNALPIIGASALSGLMPVIDQGFAVRLRAGDVAALGFGYRMISLFLSLFATAVSATVLPYYAQLASEKSWVELKQIFWDNIIKFILPITLLTSIAIILYSEPLIRLLFERGKFTGTDTKEVSAIQSMYALQLPAYVIHLVGIRLLSAIQSSHYMIGISIFSLLANIICNYYFSKMLGVKGIALSTSVVFTATMILTLFIVKFEINKRQISSFVI